MSDNADEELVGRLRARDVDALAKFLVLRQRPLMAFIERQLGAALRSKVEPDDLFQEVSAEAVRSLSSIELGDRDPFSWLCQIAERRIIDAHRRYFGAQKRSAAREVSLGTPVGGDQSRAALVDLLVMTMTTASQAFSRNQREMKLLDAMGQLNEEQREALRMRYLEGLPSKEIASRMGKTDGAVRVMLSRSLDRLQTILGPDAAPR